jgi:hypothetical protein
MTISASPTYRPKRHHFDPHAEGLAQNIADGDPDDLLTPQYVASKLGVSVQWLELGRAKGYGPPHRQLSKRMPRYQRAETVAWLRSRPKGKPKTPPPTEPPPEHPKAVQSPKHISNVRAKSANAPIGKIKKPAAAAE